MHSQSGWNTTTAGKTMDALRVTLINHGLPEVFVTDNIPKFTSAEFQIKISWKTMAISHLCLLHTTQRQTAWQNMQFRPSSIAWRKTLKDGSLLEFHSSVPLHTSQTAVARMSKGIQVSLALQTQYRIEGKCYLFHTLPT